MKKIILALLCVFMLSACKKEKDTAPEISETPKTTGNLKGKVNQYEQFGTLYKSGLNTTTVSIEGTGFTTITDSAGHYNLTDVPTNTYTLVFKKPNCGLIKRQNIHYVFSDTTTYTASIADMPSFTLNTAYAKDTSWFAASLNGIYYNAAATNTNASIVAIIGKSSNINIADPTSYINYATASPLKIADFSRFFSYSLLKDTYNFKKDSILYIKIYPVAPLGSSYFDNTLQTPVFTAYGTPYPIIFALYVH